MNIKPPKFLLLLSFLALTSCTYLGMMHVVKRDDRVSSYGAAIRFGEYSRAADFQNPAKRVQLDLEWLKYIHVSSYDAVYRKDDGFDAFEQTVNIRYFNEQNGIEKTTTDHQIWHYYPEKDQWMLETDLPSFQ